MTFEIANNSIELRLRGGGNLYCPHSNLIPSMSAQYCPGYNMCNPFPSNCCNLPVIILTTPQHPSVPVPLSQEQPVPAGFVTPHQPIPIPSSIPAPKPVRYVSPPEYPGRFKGLKRRIFPEKFSLPPINLAGYIPEVSQKKEVEAVDDPANAVINVELVPVQKSEIVPPQPKRRVKPNSTISDSEFVQPPFHSTTLGPRQVIRPNPLIPPGPPKPESFKSLGRDDYSAEPGVSRQMQQSIAQPHKTFPSQVTYLEAMLADEPYVMSPMPQVPVYSNVSVDSDAGESTRRNADFWNKMQRERSAIGKDVIDMKDKEHRIRAIQQQPNWRQEEEERRRVAELLQAFFRQRRNFVARITGYNEVMDEASRLNQS